MALPAGSGLASPSTTRSLSASSVIGRVEAHALGHDPGLGDVQFQRIERDRVDWLVHRHDDVDPAVKVGALQVDVYPQVIVRRHHGHGEPIAVGVSESHAGEIIGQFARSAAEPQIEAEVLILPLALVLQIFPPGNVRLKGLGATGRAASE